MNQEITQAEREFDQLLDYLKSAKEGFFGNDVRCIRTRLQTVSRAPSGVEMLQNARQGLHHCIEYWAQTPTEFIRLQSRIRILDPLVDTIWEQRDRFREELDGLHLRLREKIEQFLREFITGEEVRKSGNGGRSIKGFSTPDHVRNRRR